MIFNKNSYHGKLEHGFQKNRSKAHVFSFKLCGFLLWFITMFSGCNTRIGNLRAQQDYKYNKYDTIYRTFLYEVNVPLQCYTRFDQTERGHNLILYDSLISNTEIDLLYEKGIFVVSYEPIISDFIMKNRQGLSQNKERIMAFHKKASLVVHQNDSISSSELIYDKSRILTYRKINARIVVTHLGKLSQLIPFMKNYTCCYSNQMKEIETFFIVDILEFDLGNVSQ